MRWQIEAAVKQALSALPAGPRVYRLLQERMGHLGTLDPAVYWAERGRVLDPLEQDTTLVGLRLLEIGTGWHPVVALVAAARGAESVVTMDLNRWISASTLRAAAHAALEIVGDAPLLRMDRIGLVRKIAERELDDRAPGALLADLDIDYRAPSDATDTGLPAGSIDLVVHTDVFEHIPPSVVDRILGETWRVLRPGGLHVARICPGDHFAERDHRITTANHLQFSDWTWRFIGGSGIAYHNRLRPLDFRESFERAGFTVINTLPRLDRNALEGMAAGRVRPHPRFARYSIDELATTSFHLIAKRR